MWRHLHAVDMDVTGGKESRRKLLNKGILLSTSRQYTDMKKKLRLLILNDNTYLSFVNGIQIDPTTQ